MSTSRSPAHRLNSAVVHFALFCTLCLNAPAALGVTPSPPAEGDAAPPWSATCAGLGSGGPAPQLFGVGPLTPQSTNSFEMAGGPAFSPAILVFGLSQISAPFKGGTLCPDPLLLLFGSTDASGSLSLPFALGGGPVGLTGHAQFWLGDAGAPHGYVASNGLALVTQPEPAPASLHFVARLERVTRQTHLMGVETVLDHYALVSSNLGLGLVDILSLAPEGSTQSIDTLPGLDCFTTYTRADGYVYVNLRQGGLAVVRLDAQKLELSLVKTISEPGVFFEKMCLVGDRLFVTAHSHGLRIYSLANPASPQLVGSLTDGLADAFAVAVQGTQAWIADGDAGLKVVDVSDESAPVVTFGEDPLATLGAAEDVRIIGQHAYVAHGSAGVAVHPLADPSLRTLYDTPTCAKHLAQAGPWLGVADIGGVEVFRIQPDGSLSHAARERGLYRNDPVSTTGLMLRLWHGIGNWGDDHFLVANWDNVDLFQVVDPALDSQPDILLSTQRIRFAPAGGTAHVEVANAGSGVLQIDSIAATAPSFTTSASSATLQPGEVLDLTITYAGGQPGTALVRLLSDDPDEGVAPIQVFGETAYIDPTEPAIPFVLPEWNFDHGTKTFLHDTFDLDLVDGQVLFFQAFATW